MSFREQYPRTFQQVLQDFGCLFNHYVYNVCLKTLPINQRDRYGYGNTFTNSVQVSSSTHLFINLTKWLYVCHFGMDTVLVIQLDAKQVNLRLPFFQMFYCAALSNTFMSIIVKTDCMMKWFIFNLANQRDSKTRLAYYSLTYSHSSSILSKRKTS